MIEKIAYHKWDKGDPSARASYKDAFKELYSMMDVVMQTYGFETDGRCSKSIDIELANLLKDGREIFLAQTPQGNIVGYIITRPSTYYPTLLHICELFVHPSYRMRGIGRGLLNHIEEEARQSGFTVVGLHVHPENPALALYQSHGFTAHTMYMEKGIQHE